MNRDGHHHATDGLHRIDGDELEYAHKTVELEAVRESLAAKRVELRAVIAAIVLRVRQGKKLKTHQHNFVANAATKSGRTAAAELAAWRATPKDKLPDLVIELFDRLFRAPEDTTA
jgi:hypothetical protein